MRACTHAAAGNDHRGNVQTGRRLVAAGNDVIAGGDHADSVKLMHLADSLNAHADDVAHDLLIFHLLHAVWNVTAGRWHAELNRNAACRPNALLHGLSDLTQVRRSG